MTNYRVVNSGDLGIQQDPFPHELPDGAWSAGSNIRMRDGYVERIGPQSTIYDPPSIPAYFMLPVEGNSGKFLVYAGLNKIYCALAGTHTNITRQTASVDVNYTATADNVWTGGVLSGIAVLNNGSDAPQSWAGSAGVKAQDLSNWPASTTCKALRPFKNFLVALNVTKAGTNYPYMVKWSHEADPGTVPPSWDPTDTTKDAGEFDLGDEDYGAIVDGLQMGDTFIVYRETAYYAMQFIGAPYIFRFQKISSYAGLLSNNCIARFPGGHVFMSNNDVLMHSGGEPRSICTGRMQKYIFNNIDGSYFRRSFLVAHPNYNEIWVCFPTSGSQFPNVAAVWNWQEDTWAIRDLPSVSCGTVGVFDSVGTDTFDGDSATMDSDNTPFNFSSFASAVKRMIMASPSYTPTGVTLTDFTAYVQREGLDMGIPERLKLVKGVRPRIDAPPGTIISIQVGSSMDLTSGITWQAAKPFTAGTSLKIDTICTGRYLAVKFFTDLNAKWRLRSFDIEYNVLGKF